MGVEPTRAIVSEQFSATTYWLASPLFLISTKIAVNPPSFEILIPL
jgi:hypothetical protein